MQGQVVFDAIYTCWNEQQLGPLLSIPERIDEI
jgi:hypothetical protein